ncbi:hypothetical protein BU15DRAFT_81702 [Melanogaster broomeanus]|nr:hypothetical protein BU15DRAFT_81702 [Melanogaster broomeanus]
MNHNGHGQRRRQERAWIAEERTTPIVAFEVGPLPHQIERGCFYHFCSYICYGQRDPNINPVGNEVQSSARLGRAKLRFLRGLDRFLVRLRIKKPSAAPTTTPPSNGPTPDQPPPIVTITPPTIDTSTTPVHPSLASGPPSDQPPPVITITSPTIDTSTTPVHPSEAPSQAPNLTVSSPQPQPTSSMHESSSALTPRPPSSSTAAVPCPSCPPQEDDLALLSVLSPEEIGMIHEHRRRNGTSADFSAGPEHDHQSLVYSGLPGIARLSTSSVGLDLSQSHKPFTFEDIITSSLASSQLVSTDEY